jgi:hypothetical protein
VAGFFVAKKSNYCLTTPGILSKHFGPVSPQQFVHSRSNLRTVVMAVAFKRAQMLVAFDPLDFYCAQVNINLQKVRNGLMTQLMA